MEWRRIGRKWKSDDVQWQTDDTMGRPQKWAFSSFARPNGNWCGARARAGVGAEVMFSAGAKPKRRPFQPLQTGVCGQVRVLCRRQDKALHLASNFCTPNCRRIESKRAKSQFVVGGGDCFSTETPTRRQSKYANERGNGAADGGA